MYREAFQAPDPGVLDFYSRHPINVEQILAALRERGTALDGLRPEDLFDLDQDHYGGLAAVDVLATRARIGPESRVLDLCAGLGGPARYLAHRLGCRVTALDLNPTRCVGAHHLNGLVGLSQVVQVARGNATTLPFQSESFNACISQEAFLHIPRKAALLRECRRVLKPGGTLTFTDWIAGRALAEADRQELRRSFAAQEIETADGYRHLLTSAGFDDVTVEDLSSEWRDILRERLRMYRSLREETVARFGQARFDDYDRLYTVFVDLVQSGKLGGARFSAIRSAESRT